MADEPLTVGEAFPADDPVARWFFALSAFVIDLMLADRRLHEAMEDGPREAVYALRVLAWLLYEAHRIAGAIEAGGAVTVFIESLPSETREAYEDFAAVYRATHPDGKSEVQDTFGLLRHRTVHYMWPDSTELTETLRAASDEVANVVTRPEQGRIRFEYADVTLVHSLFGDVNNPEGREAFERAVSLSQRLTSMVGQLPTLTLREYLIRRNVEPRRVFRTEPEAPESRER